MNIYKKFLILPIRYKLFILAALLVITIFSVNIFAILSINTIESNIASLKEEAFLAKEVLERAKKIEEKNDQMNESIRTFGEMKYWVTDLAATWKIESETKAKIAKEDFLKQLAILENFAPHEIALIKNQTELSFEKALKSVLSFSGGNRVQGYTFLSQARHGFYNADKSIIAIHNKIKDEFSYANKKVLIAINDSARSSNLALDDTKSALTKNLVSTVIFLSFAVFIVFAIHKINEEGKKKLEESEKRFRFAVEGANDGIWEWDITKDSTWHSNRCYEMLGYDNSDLKEKIEDWENIIHPDDRIIFDKQKNAHLENNATFNIIARFRHKNGSFRYLLCRSSSVRDKHNKPVKLIGIFTDFTEMMRMQDELSYALQEAKDANQAKSEFLTNMSHEMRTPLHGLISYANMGIEKIEQDKAQKEKMLHYLKSIKVNGNNLLRLVNDLLDLAKIESGKMSFNFNNSDIHSTISEVAVEFDYLKGEKGLFINSASNMSFDTEYDDYRIKQVIRNLIANAQKFTPVGKNITIHLNNALLTDESSSKDIQAVRISVEDQGIGIPDGELSKIFEKFEQSSKTKDGSGGTGLGLSICKEIIKVHGGKIWAENNIAEGATFHFILPRKQKILTCKNETA